MLIPAILKKIIQHLEECYEQEIDVLMKAGRQAEDGDSIPLEFSMNESLPIKERAVFSNTGVSLEERLYRHVDYYLCDLEKKESELIALMKESIGSYRRISVIYEGMTMANIRAPIDSMLLFSPFWIRDPLHWDRNSNVSLVEHLFVEYPVPKGMYRDWHFPLEKSNMKWIIWFILLAQGGSLKRASKWFGWKVSPRYQHYYIQLVRQYSYTLSEVVTLDLVLGAEINRLGGSDRHMLMFQQNPVFRIDPTNNGMMSREFMRFWYQSVHWFINNGEYIDDNQYEAILQWAAHQYTESQRDGTFFSWKGRTTGNVIEASAEYLQKINAPGQDVNWDYHGLDWRYHDDSGKVWTVNEITNGKELSMEGKALMHCVGEYAARCLAGKSALFSMKCNQERVVTIELDGSLKNILQARGYKNRTLNQQERHILNLWHQQSVSSELKEETVRPEVNNELQKILNKYQFKDFYSFNRKGNYILHETAEEGNIDEVIKILDAILDIDHSNNSGKTALMIAVENRNKELVSELINRGADINIATCPQRNALAIAIRREDVRIIRMLIQNKVKVWPHHILQVLKKKNPIIINILKKMDVDLNRATPNSVTALNMAVRNEDVCLVKKLLDLEVRIDLPSYLESMSSENSEITRIIKKTERGVSAEYF